MSERPAFDIDALPRPAVTVDIAVFTVVDDRLHVLLVTRGQEPFRDRLALPGGFVHVGPGNRGGETVEEAAARELMEETGLRADQVPLQWVQAFGAPDRDPRERVITIAYFALVRPELVPFVRGGSDAAAARFVPVDDATGLAFDHDAILAAARAALLRDVEDGGLALHLVPAAFTIAELRRVHEAITGRTLDKGNFRRAFQQWLDDERIEEAPGKRVTGKRPAQVYRARAR